MLVAGATTAWGVPHLLYHLFCAGDLPTADDVASIGGLVAFVVFASAIFTVARNPKFTSPGN